MRVMYEVRRGHTNECAAGSVAALMVVSAAGTFLMIEIDAITGMKNDAEKSSILGSER